MIYPLITISNGKTLHFLPTTTFGSGVFRTKFGIICLVFSNHQALVWVKACPLKGMEANILSKALCLSVAIKIILSSACPASDSVWVK